MYPFLPVGIYHVVTLLSCATLANEFPNMFKDEDLFKTLVFSSSFYCISEISASEILHPT